MTELSPAARAIVRAFVESYEQCGPYDENWPKLCLAAALRELVYRMKRPAPSAERQAIRAYILRIAAELEKAT